MVIKSCLHELHCFFHIIHIAFIEYVYTFLTFLYKELKFCLNIIRFEHFKLSVWQNYQSDFYEICAFYY